MTAGAGAPRRLALSPDTRRALLLWAIPAAFLAFFFFYPLAAILKIVFGPESGFALARVGWMTVWRPLRFTLWQAALSTLLTLLIGLPAAYLFARYAFRGKRLLRVLTTLPFIMPTVVVAAAFNALLGPRGWVNVILMSLFDLSTPPVTFLNTLWAILLAHVFYNTTIVIRLVGSAWAQLDPRLEQAAQVLGADRARTFREVTLPLPLPAVLTGFVFAFMSSFDEVTATLFWRPANFDTVPIYVLSELQNSVSQELNALAAALVGFSISVPMLVMLLLHLWSIRPRRSGIKLPVEQKLPWQPGIAAEGERQ
jgi:thiamine transport system permease protein